MKKILSKKSVFYFILIFDLNFKDITRNEIYNCAKKFSGYIPRTSRGLYYKIYDVFFTPSYRGKNISRDALHR